MSLQSLKFKKLGTIITNFSENLDEDSQEATEYENHTPEEPDSNSVHSLVYFSQTEQFFMTPVVARQQLCTLIGLL